MNFKLIALALPALFLIACDQSQKAQQPAEVTIETDKDKFSYGLGMMIGERVLNQYGEVDYDKLIAGIKAQHLKQATLMTLEEADAALRAEAEKVFAARAEETKKRGQEYLDANAKKEGVTVTESGLQYSVITAADGAKPKETDTVTVHYRGTLIDGTEFDSSYERGSPTSFGLNQVIPGWTEGLQLMSVGSKYRLVIPSDLGYGDRGAGGQIGPFETLIFEVELLEIGG